MKCHFFHLFVKGATKKMVISQLKPPKKSGVSPVLNERSSKPERVGPGLDQVESTALLSSYISGDRQGCTPIPTYPVMGNPYISPIYPYSSWVFMGYYPQESLYKPYRYHGYTVTSGSSFLYILMFSSCGIRSPTLSTPFGSRCFSLWLFVKPKLSPQNKLQTIQADVYYYIYIYSYLVGGFNPFEKY